MPKFEKNEVLATYNIPGNDIGMILSNVDDQLRPAL
jgi:hypothetical protein